MYSKILVPVDGSGASRRGLAEAVKLAKALGAQLRLVHVVNEFFAIAPDITAMYAQEMIESLRAVGKQILADSKEYVHKQSVEAQSVLLESIGGRAADLIMDQVKEWQPELIVMGTHGRRGVRRMVMGSDAETMLRLSPVPVLMVRDDS
jgi:nucleotide-binding universal stress UspA family protein